MMGQVEILKFETVFVFKPDGIAATLATNNDKFIPDGKKMLRNRANFFISPHSTLAPRGGRDFKLGISRAGFGGVNLWQKKKFI